MLTPFQRSPIRQLKRVRVDLVRRLVRVHVFATIIAFICWHQSPIALIRARAANLFRDDRERGIEALPAYVAASTDMLCFETPDYGDRAWCRLERAVAYAFMFSGVRTAI